jgi:hypothetical protein
MDIIVTHPHPATKKDVGMVLKISLPSKKVISFQRYLEVNQVNTRNLYKNTQILDLVKPSKNMPNKTILAKMNAGKNLMQGNAKNFLDVLTKHLKK